MPDSNEMWSSFDAARDWLAQCRFKHPQTAYRCIAGILANLSDGRLIRHFLRGMEKYLSTSPDSDMALNNFDRWLSRQPSLDGTLIRLDEKPQSLAVMLQLFSASQYFSDLMIENPAYFDFIWEHGSDRLDPDQLREEIVGAWTQGDMSQASAMELIRRYRGRELLRIGFRDIILGEPVDAITQSISDLADCLANVALIVSYRRQSARFGEPRTESGRYSSMVVLGLGKLGGRELNYSSDIDLIVIYEEDGRTDGAAKSSVTNNEFFSAIVRELAQLLSTKTGLGFAYRVDLRLRPHGSTSQLCMSLPATLSYYDKHGRTWERQMLVKARPIAGSASLGRRFLAAITPFIYRRFLTFVEINEIKAIKRQIERKANAQGDETTNLKTGKGGIRDIEFVVQFLQLLHGGENLEIRHSNTLIALRRLMAAGCINPDEYSVLETSYRFLRKAEHRLQYMFDLQRHTLPESTMELQKLALRMGYLARGDGEPHEEFLRDLREIGRRNQTILRHLMLDLFSQEGLTQDADGSLESELILDPEPSEERLAVLKNYGFSSVQRAYRNLMLLATEEVPFLSSTRCRHFLASIAGPMLRAISKSPDPDLALVNLEKVTASLGAKGVLWESMSHNAPMLLLYVNLCSWSQYLSEILINNPGMIDELLDTLVMNRSPTRDDWRQELASLLKGADDHDLILHSFKNTQLLQIGMGDILQRESLRETLESLSDLAEVIVEAIANHHYERISKRWGDPWLDNVQDRSTRYALVAMGKLGGRELGYHGDLDLVLVYEADGRTRPRGASGESRSNQEFFVELSQGIVKSAGAMTPQGRLYAIDFRLRPGGRHSPLAVPLDRFQSHYAESAEFWERLAMTRARVIIGHPEFSQKISQVISESATNYSWNSSDAEEASHMRARLEKGRSREDLKRGPGGEMDIEFAVQMAQVKYAPIHPTVLEPNIWEAIDRLRESDIWPKERAEKLRENYTLLRLIENRMRLVYNSSRHELPTDEAKLHELARRSGFEGASSMLADIRPRMEQNRQEWIECLEEARG